MKPLLRSAAGTILDLPALRGLLRRRNRALGIVFMLHRFGRDEHDVELLRSVLRWIDRRRIPVLAVDALVRGLRAGRLPPGPVLAFTLDDGYRDQAEIAAPAFIEYGVPATIYPVVDFVDGTSWLWWDRLEHLLAASEGPEIEVDLGAKGILSFATGSEGAVRATTGRLTQILKEFPASERDALIAELAERRGVEIPANAPSRYAAMSWDDARRLEREGISFGAHTLSHPILARESEERARDEILGSWSRLQAEVERPVPIFCYSNGRSIDFGPREIAIVREAGLEGALAADGGLTWAHGSSRHATLTRLADNGECELDLYRIPRFSLPVELASFIRVTAGLRSARQIALPPLTA